MPLVPTLFEELQDAHERAPDGSQMIVALSRNNLHRGLEAIIKRAGLVPWDDLWQTLRRSCETQWALEFPQHVVSQWIGHSVAVSLKHYVQTPEYLLDMAAAGTPLRAAKSAAVNPGTGGNGAESQQCDKPETALPENEASPAFAGTRAWRK